MVIGRTDRSTERLNNSLGSLKWVPPAPLSHALLNELIAEVRIRNLADNLEAAEVSLKVNSFCHRWSDENSRFLAADVLIEDVLSILRLMCQQPLALYVLHDVAGNFVGAVSYTHLMLPTKRIV